MDVKTAIELIESGRFEEIDIDDIWELIDILSASSDPRAFQALTMLQNSKIGHSLPQINRQMQYHIEQNMLQIEKLEKKFNLFETNAQGMPIQQDLLPIFSFFSRVEVDNKETAEKVDGKKLFAQAAEIAKITAKKDLCTNKNFSKLKPEEQQKSYVNSVVMAMEETAFVLVSNQLIEDNLQKRQEKDVEVKSSVKAKVVTEPSKVMAEPSKKALQLTKDEEKQITQLAEIRFAEMINPKSVAKFKLSNDNILSTLTAELNRAAQKEVQIEKHTQAKALTTPIKEADKNLSKEYPKTFEMLRAFAAYPDLSFVAGNSGRHLFSANKIAETVHKYNPAKGQQEKTLFVFLKEQPQKLKSFSRHIVSSIKKTYQHIKEAISLNFSSEKIANSFKKMFSSVKEKGEYKEIGAKTIEGNLRIMSATASRLLQAQEEADPNKKVIAWKNFRSSFYNSQLGRAMALDPEKTQLVTEDVKEYITVTPIVINKKTSAGKNNPAPKGKILSSIIGLKSEKVK